jgi:hypothetical protein
MKLYNRRQFILMQTQIGQFRTGRLELGTLIANLEALSVALEQPEQGFLDAFHEHWFDLEQVLAVALDGRYEQVVADNRELIEQAVDTLASLVADQLQRSEDEGG